MIDDLMMTLDDLAALFRCSRRHARDVIAKGVGFPSRAPGASPKNPLWVRAEVVAYVHRKPAKPSSSSRKDPESSPAFPS